RLQGLLETLLGYTAAIPFWRNPAGSSDFCVDPDTYVTRMVEERSVLSGDILQYYLACSPRAANPFQQKLSGSHKALVEMQDVVAELLKTVPREQPAAKDYVQALTGFCYDGVEGLIYLALFSFVTALMFSSIVCSVPHTWQQKSGGSNGDDDASHGGGGGGGGDTVIVMLEMRYLAALDSGGHTGWQFKPMNSA
ncbi:hypothetical protein E2I00_001915, partial [Balaenoptera physalus]